MTFVVYYNNPPKRRTYSNWYNESDEYERDAAWDDVREQFPDADYIEAL